MLASLWDSLFFRDDSANFTLSMDNDADMCTHHFQFVRPLLFRVHGIAGLRGRPATAKRVWTLLGCKVASVCKGWSRTEEPRRQVVRGVEHHEGRYKEVQALWGNETREVSPL